MQTSRAIVSGGESKDRRMIITIIKLISMIGIGVATTVTVVK